MRAGPALLTLVSLGSIQHLSSCRKVLGTHSGHPSAPVAERYVFISYARDDKAFVDRLVDDLRKRGIAVWQDVEQLAPGQNWEREIRTALLETAALLYVSSGRSARSSWVSAELHAVLGRDIPVIPIIVDDAGATHLPALLRVYQWVDFRSSYGEALERLTWALARFQRETPVEPEPTRSKGYVFISYAEEDVEFVSSLKRFLATRGYGYWDYAESDRDYHRDLFLELEGVISGAAGTLSVLSPYWKRSTTAVKEFHFSNEVGVPVFLLKAQELGPTLLIAGIPYIDFTRDESAGYAKLDRELKRKGL